MSMMPRFVCPGIADLIWAGFFLESIRFLGLGIWVKDYFGLCSAALTSFAIQNYPARRPRPRADAVLDCPK